MRKSQQGTSYLWVMIQIFLIILVAKAAMEVIPTYLDDRIINGQIVEIMQKQPNISATEFAEKANKRFEINTIRDLKFNDIAKTSVQPNGQLVVEKSYEVRKNYIHNIDLVMHFEERFDQNSIKTE